MGFHKDISFPDNHIAHSLEFANAADMNNYAASAADIGRIARKTDDNSFWILRSVAPVDWVQMVAPAPPVFGQEFAFAESPGVTTITQNTFFQKVALGPLSLAGGVYRLEVSYGWNYNNTGRDFIARVVESGAQIGEWHEQEPKDSAGNFAGTGSNQRFYVTRVFYRTLAAGQYSWALEFRSETNGVLASMWDATIAIWRVA